jgi:hypothetical protein
MICAGVSFFFLPNFTPRRRAYVIPACVRSTIKLRSSSASTPIICQMARPVGVVASIRAGQFIGKEGFTPGLHQAAPLSGRAL